MTFHSHWTLACETRTKEKAIRVKGRLLDLLKYEVHALVVDPDVDIPGFAVRFCADLHGTTWEQAVSELICAVLPVGDRWMIGGDGKRRFSLSSNHMFVPGIQWCEAEISLDLDLCVRPTNYPKLV